VADVPSSTRVVIVGAGFAGASTAWGLAALDAGPGVLLEAEPTIGVHASGRNAGLLKMSEDDPLIRTMAVRTLRQLIDFEPGVPDLMRRCGGLTLGAQALSDSLDAIAAGLRNEGVAVDRLDARGARGRFSFLAGVEFDTALWCPDEGVVDVHALLTHYLKLARAGGFHLHVDCRVTDLATSGGRVVGVETTRGRIECDVVIDATGAWAGRLGRAGRPLPMQPVRRHLFVSGPVAGGTRAWPFVWADGADFYFRSEGDGLLLSPCDQTPFEPCLPNTDPAAAEMLAEKLARHAPGLGNLGLRKSWACLRTFAPDRRPVIGADPERPGLFHVSGLGGSGMMTSAAVGEAAARVVTGVALDWIDPADVSPARLLSGRPPSV
jgi:glycine/D-amino acid oxidase-like deaminating enzyme